MAEKILKLVSEKPIVKSFKDLLKILKTLKRCKNSRAYKLYYALLWMIND